MIYHTVSLKFINTNCIKRNSSKFIGHDRFCRRWRITHSLTSTLSLKQVWVFKTCKTENLKVDWVLRMNFPNQVGRLWTADAFLLRSGTEINPTIPHPKITSLLPFPYPCTTWYYTNLIALLPYSPITYTKLYSVPHITLPYNYKW